MRTLFVMVLLCSSPALAALPSSDGVARVLVTDLRSSPELSAQAREITIFLMGELAQVEGVQT